MAILNTLSRMSDNERRAWCRANAERIVKESLTAWSDTVNEYCKELEYVLNESIRHYYSYRTSRYYRHGTGRGSGTGKNLFKGIIVTPKTATIRGVKVCVGWDYDLNGDDMEPYTHKRVDGSYAYRPNATDVIRSVSSGIRGLFSGSSDGEWDLTDADGVYENVDEGKAGASQTWGGDVEFDSKFFPFLTYTGATADSYIQFQNHFDENIEKLAFEKLLKRIERWR